MMAQEAGAYKKDFRKQPVQTDAPRDYIDRFTQLFVVTDYAMGGDMEAMKDNPAVRWVFDHPEYEFTGIRYYGQYKPARLEVTPYSIPVWKSNPVTPLNPARLSKCCVMPATGNGADWQNVNSGV